MSSRSVSHQLGRGLAALLLFAGPKTVRADTPPPPVSPTNKAGSGISTPGFQIDASQAGSAINLKADKNWLAPNGAPTDATLTLSAPFSTNQTQVQLTTLDALAGGASLKFELAGAYFPGGDYQSRWDKYCEAKHQPKLCSIPQNSPEGLAISNPGNAYGYGVNAKIGYQSYKYYVPISYVEHSLDREPWSVGGYLAFYPTTINLGFPWMATLTYQYQDGYKVPTSKIGCPPSDASAKTCVYGDIGAPKRQYGNLIGIEFQAKPFGRVVESCPLGKMLCDALAGFAFTATPTYDATSHVWALDAPLFIVNAAKYSGGLDIKWKSDTHATSVGLIVQAPFSFATGG